MASAQQQAPAAAPVQGNKDKILEQLIKEAENIPDLDKEQNCVAGAISNKTKEDLHLSDQHSWSGYFPQIVGKSNPPVEIKKGEIGMFLHKGAPPKGSKAGVAYDTSDRQRILAWHAPRRCPEKSIENEMNKVYIECRKGHGPVDWDEIEKKLDMFGKPVYETPCGRASISQGCSAGLGAEFY